MSQMKSHVYSEHKMAGYKFQCDYCPKRFDTKAHIRVHLRKHTKESAKNKFFLVDSPLRGGGGEGVMGCPQRQKYIYIFLNVLFF